MTNYSLYKTSYIILQHLLLKSAWPWNVAGKVYSHASSSVNSKISTVSPGKTYALHCLDSQKKGCRHFPKVHNVKKKILHKVLFQTSEESLLNLLHLRILMVDHNWIWTWLLHLCVYTSLTCRYMSLIKLTLKWQFLKVSSPLSSSLSSSYKAKWLLRFIQF